MNIKANNLFTNQNSGAKIHISGEKSGKSTNIQGKNATQKSGNYSVNNSCNRSVSLELSSEGRELSKKLREDLKKSIQSEMEELRKSIVEANRLSKKLEEGDELTDADVEFVNDSIMLFSSERNSSSFKSTPQDDYGALLKKLKENYENSLNIFSKMQEKLSSGDLISELDKNAQLIARAKQEEKEKQGIVNILKDDAEKAKEQEEIENNSIGSTNSTNNSQNLSQNCEVSAQNKLTTEDIGQLVSDKMIRSISLLFEHNSNISRGMFNEKLDEIIKSGMRELWLSKI